jgi:hypothetical protein
MKIVLSLLLLLLTGVEMRSGQGGIYDSSGLRVGTFDSSPGAGLLLTWPYPNPNGQGSSQWNWNAGDGTYHGPNGDTMEIQECAWDSDGHCLCWSWVNWHTADDPPPPHQVRTTGYMY